MSKNKIESSHRDELFEGNEETDIINAISKQDFMNWLEVKGFSEAHLKQFFQEKRLSPAEVIRFNMVLKKAKEEIGVSVTESILYLENSVNRLKKIIAVLDEDTKYILKSELVIKYKIKIEKNILYKLLV